MSRIVNWSQLRPSIQRKVQRAKAKRGKRVSSSGRVVEVKPDVKKRVVFAVKTSAVEEAVIARMAQKGELITRGRGKRRQAEIIKAMRDRPKILAELEKERRRMGLANIDAVLKSPEATQRVALRVYGRDKPLYEITLVSGRKELLTEEQYRKFETTRERQKRFIETRIKQLEVQEKGLNKIKRWLRGKVEDVKGFKAGFIQDKEALQGKSKRGMATYIVGVATDYASSIVRGFLKTTNITPKLVATIPVYKHLYIMKEKIRRAKKFSDAKKPIPSNLSIKREIEGLRKAGLTLSVVEVRKYSADPDVKHLRELAIMFGIGFVGGPAFAALAKVAYVGKPLVAITGIALAASYAADVGKVARKKGLISAATQAVIEIGVLATGAKVSGKLLAKAKPVSKSKAYREIRKLSRQQRITVRQVFNRGWKRVKGIKSTQSKIAKQISVLRNKLKDAKTWKQVRSLSKRISELESLYKKVSGKKLLAKKVIPKMKGKEARLLRKEIKIKNQISKLQKHLLKAKTVSKKQGIIKRIISLKKKLGVAMTRRERLALRRVLKAKPKLKISKARARKELVKLRRDISFLLKKYKRARTKFGRKRIAKQIIKKTMRRSELEYITKRIKKPSKAAWRKAKRKEILRKLRFEERRLTKLAAKEKAVKEIAIKRVRKVKGRMPKAIRKQPITSGKYKGMYELKTPAGSVYYRSFKKWRAALAKQQRIFARKYQGIEKALAKLSRDLRAAKKIKRLQAKNKVLRIRAVSPKTKAVRSEVKKVDKIIKRSVGVVKRIRQQKGRATPGQRQQLVLLQKQKVKVKQIKKTISVMKGPITRKYSALKSLLAKGDVAYTKLIELRRDMALLGLYKLSLDFLQAQIPVLEPVTVRKLEEEVIPITIQERVVVQKLETVQRRIVQTIFVSVAAVSTGFIVGRFMPFAPPIVGKEPTPAGVRAAFRRIEARKPRHFIYLSDLYSRMYGIRAKPRERRELLRVGRVFTGLEKRPIV